MDLQIVLMLLMIPEVHECLKTTDVPKWLHDPCDAKAKLTYCDCGSDQAQKELENFNRFIEKLYKENGLSDHKAIHFRGCVNVTRTLQHLQNNTKIRVFYNMIQRWAVFLHEIHEEITDFDRRKSYQEILNRLKRLACEFRVVLCRRRKKRPFKGFSSCLLKNQTLTYSKAFDFDILSRIKDFFSESAKTLALSDEKLTDRTACVGYV